MVGRVHRQGHGHHGDAAVHRLQGGRLGARIGEGLAVPGVRQFALAYGHRIGDVVGRIHRQDHRHDGIATGHRLQGGGLRARIGEGLAIPGVRHLVQTNGSLLGDVEGVIDGQRHRHHGVTTMDCLQGSGLRARSREGLAIPSVRQSAGANGPALRNLIGRIQRQGHGHHRVATIHRLQRCGLGTGLGEDEIVPGVRQLVFTYGHGIRDMVGRVHRQGHGHHGDAAVHRLQGGRLGARIGEGLAVPGVRQFALAYGHRIGDVVGRIHRQDHRHDGVATGHRLQGNRLGARIGEGLAVPYIWHLAQANGSLLGDIEGVVDGQRHGHHRVATVDRLQSGRLRARAGEGLAVPSVWQSAGANRTGLADVIGRVDRKRHHDHGIAAIHRLQRCRLGAGLAEDEIVPGVRQLGFTYGHRIRDVVSRFQRQGHGHHRVATVHRLQGSRLGARSREGLAIPGVRQRTGAYRSGFAERVGRILKNRDRGGELVSRARSDRNGVGACRQGHLRASGSSIPYVSTWHIGAGRDGRAFAWADSGVTREGDIGWDDVCFGSKGDHLTPFALSNTLTEAAHLHLIGSVGCQIREGVGTAGDVFNESLIKHDIPRTVLRCPIQRSRLGGDIVNIEIHRSIAHRNQCHFHIVQEPNHIGSCGCHALFAKYDIGLCGGIGHLHHLLFVFGGIPFVIVIGCNRHKRVDVGEIGQIAYREGAIALKTIPISVRSL